MIDINIAVVGCLHGELDQLYKELIEAEKEKGMKIDIVLCCGDFQSTRNKQDMESIVITLKKYEKMYDFHKYYEGKCLAPFLTVFVGGNHEASNYIWQIPFGGWVAKNIYYLGISNVIDFAGIKIGGVSGIFKAFGYEKGHFERPPFNEDNKHSIYNIRKIEVEKMSLVKEMDILLSHDWPKGIWNHGNVDKLISERPDLEKFIRNNQLGCSNLMDLISKIQPNFYFCAHKHVYFSAVVKHEIKQTKFTALAKSRTANQYIELISVKTKNNDKSMHYVPEWLAITKFYSQYFNCNYHQIPSIDAPSENIIKHISAKFGNLRIPSYEECLSKYPLNDLFGMNQTNDFCQKLDITNPLI